MTPPDAERSVSARGRRSFLTCALLVGTAEGAEPPPSRAVVAEVYDGDTLTLATGDVVRLRSVNTPELAAGAEEAGAVDAREVLAKLTLGRWVSLRYGPTLRDHYGRLLASVDVNGRSVAALLVRKGLAHVFIVPPAAPGSARLVGVQRRARKARRGIWADLVYSGVWHVTSFHARPLNPKADPVDGEYVRLCNMTADALDLGEYWVENASGRLWKLPTVVVPPGHTVRVRSGRGVDQVDPARQLDVHLGAVAEIWSDERDRITIRDADGNVVDVREHVGER